jgi:hypothetical protein
MSNYEISEEFEVSHLGVEVRMKYVLCVYFTALFLNPGTQDKKRRVCRWNF